MLRLGSADPVSGQRGEGDRFLDAPEAVVAGAGDDRIYGAADVGQRILGGGATI